MPRLHIMLPDDLYDTLRDLAHIKRTSMAVEVRNALQDYVSPKTAEETSNHIKRDMVNDPNEVRKEVLEKMGRLK